MDGEPKGDNRGSDIDFCFPLGKEGDRARNPVSLPILIALPMPVGAAAAWL